MIVNALDSIKRDRAAFARDVEYVKELAKDDEIDDRLRAAENSYFSETIEELEEAAQWADRINIDDATEQSEAEVNRIMEASEDLTFDELIGITETTERRNRYEEVIHSSG